jgi:hypothetical protein
MSRRRQCITVALAIATWSFVVASLVNLAGRNAFLEGAARDCATRFRQRVGEDGGVAYSHVTLDGGLTWWRFRLVELPDNSAAVLIEGAADLETVRRLDVLEKEAQRCGSPR